MHSRYVYSLTVFLLLGAMDSPVRSGEVFTGKMFRTCLVCGSDGYGDGRGRAGGNRASVLPRWCAPRYAPSS